MSKLIEPQVQTFLELLQISVGRRETLEHEPSSFGEWKKVMKEADSQGMLGVMFSAMEKIKKPDDISYAVYISLEKAVRKIREKNAGQQEAIQSASRFFQERGFRSCVLKGQAVARYYPDPSLRQSGDVDIWVEGDRQALVSLLRKQGVVKKVVYHHCDARILEGPRLEVHFTPTWKNAFFANRRLQRWFREVAHEQFSHRDQQLGCSVPTSHFNGVYLPIHIFRHVVDEGVGMRQILDYYYVLRSLDARDRERVREDLKRLKMLRFAGALMYVLQEVFLLEETYLLCPPEAREGAFLLDSILTSGNFGQADARNAHSKEETMMGHVRRKLRRNVRLVLRYPSEVLSMPFFMLWQYFWRRKNGYLYHGR